MINKIEVKNLFGVFNHSISLTKNNEITLILGENGLGKTIILKLIKAFFDGNFHELKDFIYDELLIGFDDNTTVTIKRVLDDKSCSLKFEHESKKKKIQTYTFTSLHRNRKGRKSNVDDNLMFERRMHERSLYYRQKELFGSGQSEIDYLFERYVPTRIEKVGVNRWIEPHTGNIYSLQDLIVKYEDFFPKELLKRFGEGIPDWLTELTSRITVKLIEAQRLLLQADEGKYRSAVTNYSNQLIETIKNKRSEATDLGSNLDRTYPNRVINEIANTNHINNDFISDSFIELQEKRALLNNVGLLDTEEEDLQPNFKKSFDQEILKEVLHVYIEDSNKKLSIYDDLSKRIKLLLDIINKRFTYKKLSIDKNKGFVFTSTINGKEIPLSGLSSGEQHELVLYFELLFNTSENSLLLIDEPEISLHIS